MKQVPLIRIVDDDPSVGASFRFVLEAVGYQVRTYESAAEFLDGDDPTREGWHASRRAHAWAVRSRTSDKTRGDEV